MKKPRFTLGLAPGCMFCPVKLLSDIDEYIREYDIRGPRLREAASDVLDGYASNKELKPFYRQHLMVKESTADARDGHMFGREYDDVCGKRWTVALTDRAINIFWPDRAS